MSEIDYELWAESGFAGGTKESLREACKVFGLTVHPNAGEETLRERLRSVTGNIAPTGPVVVPDVPKVARGEGEMPNVTSVGRWGGRRYDVTVFAPADEKAKFLPIGWEGDPLYVKFGELTHLPEPHYHSLNNAKIKSFEISARPSHEGAQRSETERVQHVYPFSCTGVTPGTEHLPGSLLEWYQWRAEAKDYFARYTRQALEKIYGELYNGPPKDNWDKEKIRYEILRFLGPEYAQKAYKEEEDAA